MKTGIFAFTLSILVCLTARAELKWEQTQVELHPAVGDKTAVGHFKYQNTGDKPVRFKSVRSSCGCTTAQTQKDEVPPGEKGEITATFKTGGRTGIQLKNVTVETDDPAHPVTVLTLKTVLPEVVEITPSFVYWTSGEAPKPKTVVVRPVKDFPINELKVTSSNLDFSTKVERDKATGTFKIDVAPKQTTSQAVTTLTLQPDNSTKLFYVNARVMNAPAAQ